MAISAITYCAQGDATRATLAVTVKRKSLQRLQLFTAGYIKGGSVRLLAQQSGQAPIALLPEKSNDEQWQPLYFSVPSGWGPGDITFTLTDDATGGFGWGGLGLGKRRHLAGDASAYAIVALHAVAIAGLLLLPGLLWRSCIGPLPLSLLPVPGIILLALNGLALWILPASAAQWFRAGLAGIYLLLPSRSCTAVGSGVTAPERQGREIASSLLRSCWPCCRRSASVSIPRVSRRNTAATASFPAEWSPLPGPCDSLRHRRLSPSSLRWR
ncbi:hypothetical protein RMA73_14555 [Xanthomonas translucens pv. translucens]|uniref:hypothetical protein n=1 Tax=Xanthomonas campestris pv. translucens TaxID=343 RepID=UPI00288B4DC6|nr:hypothetical protein [Xanthomonas translucens]WNJ26086.1 hypothetical protein RMA73_14555 [Xanthomonas translucens pv. translucens]